MKLLSIQEAAKELGVTRQGMYHIVKNGMIDPKKIIVTQKPVCRIYASEIEKLKIQRNKK